MPRSPSTYAAADGLKKEFGVPHGVAVAAVERATAPGGVIDAVALPHRLRDVAFERVLLGMSLWRDPAAYDDIPVNVLLAAAECLTAVVHGRTVFSRRSWRDKRAFKRRQRERHELATVADLPGIVVPRHIQGTRTQARRHAVVVMQRGVADALLHLSPGEDAWPVFVRENSGLVARVEKRYSVLVLCNSDTNVLSRPTAVLVAPVRRELAPADTT